MKMISAKVISSAPISLDISSKFLSKFVSSETEVSQSNKSFLRRTSASFNELNQHCKQFRPSKPDLKREKHRAVEVKEVVVVGFTGSDHVKLEINSVREDGVVDKEKKRKKRRGEVKKEVSQSEKHGSKKKRIRSEKS